MKRGLMFVGLLGVVVAMMIMADFPLKPGPAEAQDEIWRPAWGKGIQGADYYYYSGADTVTAALTVASKCWLVTRRVGPDTTAADTLYFKVHDKTNDAWLVMRVGTTPMGGIAKEWRYGPEIDSVYYATPNASAWLRLECYW